MTTIDLLLRAVDREGQAAVARATGYSASAISQAVRGSYGGRLERLLYRVAEVYGDGTVRCPVMGEIPLRRCAEEQRKPAAASSPQRLRLSRACRECRHRRA